MTERGPFVVVWSNPPLLMVLRISERQGLVFASDTEPPTRFATRAEAEAAKAMDHHPDTLAIWPLDAWEERQEELRLRRKGKAKKATEEPTR